LKIIVAQIICIQTIPITLIIGLKKLHYLNLGGNPIRKATVPKRYLKCVIEYDLITNQCALLNYLHSLVAAQKKDENRLKLMILGGEQVGKTSEIKSIYRAVQYPYGGNVQCLFYKHTTQRIYKVLCSLWILLDNILHWLML